MKRPNKHGGGAVPNINGLHFEQETSLDEALIRAGFVIDANHDVWKNGIRFGKSVKKNSFYKLFLEPNGIDYRKYNSKRWLPDECFVNENTKTVYVIEKKFQNSSGSVDEKLSACVFKRAEYQKLLTPLGYHAEYMHVMNDWFRQPQYKDILNYCEENQSPYFFNNIPLEAIGLYDI